MALRADDVDLDRDAALVERFQTGDEDAFADLYTRYFGRLRRYCQRRLGNPHDGEEAAQEALIRAYRALPTFGGDRRFYPWLRVIATNVCNDRCKRKPVAALADAEGGDVVIDSVFDAMDRAFVRAALQELNPRHQTALALWAEGRPSRDIADQLGCSTGAVDVTLHRARQSFRTRFLAMTGDGKLAGLGLLPAVGRWAQRWRVRIVSRAGEYTGVASPLAAKVAAGAIAITVVGGAVATTSTPSHEVRPSAPPSSVVHLQTAPVAADAPAPAVSTSNASTTARPTPATPQSAQPTSAPPQAAPAPEVAGARVMTAQQADQEGKGSPVDATVPGVAGATVDPQALVASVLPPKGAS